MLEPVITAGMGMKVERENLRSPLERGKKGYRCHMWSDAEMVLRLTEWILRIGGEYLYLAYQYPWPEWPLSFPGNAYCERDFGNGCVEARNFEEKISWIPWNREKRGVEAKAGSWLHSWDETC